jgi:uncharacterized protein (DUF427 family)
MLRASRKELLIKDVYPLPQNNLNKKQLKKTTNIAACPWKKRS